MIIKDITYSNQPLENKEKIIFDIISILDKESFDLFCEIMDLSKESFYKTDDLIDKYKSLKYLLENTVSAYNRIYKMEEESYNYARSRFQFKSLVTFLASAYIATINIFASILSWILLMKRSIKSYGNELDYIGSNLDNFDDEKIKKIEVTLDNCKRILEGKLNRQEEPNNDDLNYTYLVVMANKYISAFLNEQLYMEDVNYIPSSIKKYMTNILKKDLNVDVTDLKELLKLAKNKKNNEFSVVKRYVKN